ncbi:MAG: alpha/beta hydrolase [Clostridiales bacterium]|nr:alpha/beta hydrolase [Clostridiales bacterium]
MFTGSNDIDRKMDQMHHDEYYDATARARRKKNVRKGFCITFVVMLLVSLLNWGIVSGWGAVRIDRIKLIGADGAEYSGFVYTPKDVTDENPAPGILMFHGNAGNARNHESWAVEMSRRGFVVVAPDQFGSGESQGYFDNFLSTESLLQEAETFYHYMLDMSIVDQDNIVSSGHSMGNNASMLLGAKYNAKLVFAASPVNLPPDGNADDLIENWNHWVGNYIATMGEYEKYAATASEGGQLELDKRGIDAKWEAGTIYGSLEEQNIYIYYLEHRIHEAAFVSQLTIGHLIDACQLVIGDAVPNPIPSDNQVWMYKDYVGMLGTVSFVAFLCALALLLIEEIPAFAMVRRPIAANKGLRGVGMVISIVLGVLFPYIVLKTDAFGLIGGRYYENLDRLGFRMGFSNMAFGTMVGVASLGVLGFLLYYFTEGKKKQFTLMDSGLTPEDYENADSKGKAILTYVGKTLLLAAIVVGLGWSYIHFMENTLGSSFYSWFFGIKEIPLSKLPYYWNYLVVWMLCFVVSNLGINVERRLPSTGKETLDIVLAMIFNIVVVCFTITVVVGVKWILQTAGSAADTNMIWSMGVDTQRIWGMPLGMACGIGGSTFLYKKTGNTWLSAFLMGSVACLMCLVFGSSRFHF